MELGFRERIFYHQIFLLSRVKVYIRKSREIAITYIGLKV